jgi:hypothetical protein
MPRTRTLLSMIVVCLTASVSQATIFQFDAYLDGLQETPPNGSPGTGYGSLFLDDTTGNWSVTNGVFSDLTASANNAHIHGPAAAGSGPAGVIAPLTFDPATSGTWGGSGTFTAAQMADLQNSLYYVNIHSGNFPGGEIRGQLLLVPEPSPVALVGLGLALLAVGRRRTLARSA